ncbi:MULTISPECIES: hypothetical protein [unclassified Blastomonas]|uniref:hypothetical protein n=1 Tax=unclassified Blastomonas TaxID=2626550 RepID=UPI00082568AD|nr:MULTISPECIES: hypothetical protein [unclassified Blastomonas]
MSTSRFAPLAKVGQVSADAIASAIASMSADDLKGALSAEQLAALAPAPTPAASEDAGDKPKKMKGKGKKDKMESEDAEYDDEDEMEASAADTAPLATAAEIGNAFMAVFPSASASQILACISITDRAKAAAPAVASEPDEGTAELAALIKHNATNLDAGGGEAPKAKNHGWDDIHAEVRQLRGH